MKKLNYSFLVLFIYLIPELNNVSALNISNNLNVFSKTLTIEIKFSKIRNTDRFDNISESILSFCKEYYIRKNAKFVLLEKEESEIKFEVSGLKNEVLIDSGNPFFADLLGLDWRKTELLSFQISTSRTIDSIVVKIILEGKYASGMFNPTQKSGFIDMEIDYNEYLEVYAKRFQNSLRQYLLPD